MKLYNVQNMPYFWTTLYLGLQQSAIHYTRQFGAISTEFSKKMLKPFLFNRSFPTWFIVLHSSDVVLIAIATFVLNALSLTI